MKTLAALFLACAIVAAFSLWSRRLQAPTSVVVWDAGQYYTMTTQLAAGTRPYAESPYVFRVGVPWLVSRRWAADPARGFFLINLASAFAVAILLVVWLRAWGLTGWIPLAMVLLVAVAWHGPVRYLYYNPGYVDPPFIALLLAGLLLIRSIAASFDGVTLAMLVLLSTAGALVRETMLLVPLCFVFVNGPVHALVLGRKRTPPVPAWAILLPLAGCLGAIAFTHVIVTVDATERASMVQAAVQWLRKAPDSYVMGWLAAFGPVLAVIAFDWRRALQLLADHEWLAAFFAGCAAVAFFGGSDTERFAFWSMPVVYLLLARAFERHAGVLRSAPVAAALVVAQAVSARVFWGIPDPRAEHVVALSGTAGWSARLFGVLDRLIVIDSFHFNLWSSFGSRPFRLLRIAVYLIVMTGLVGLIALQDRKVALRPLRRAGHGPEHLRVAE